MANSATGVLTGTTAFGPWGERRASTGEQAVLGFQGDPTDTDTGLVDMLTRAYDPAQGRFTSGDSLFGDPASPMSLNPYAYGWDNPVSLIDPTGMCPADRDCGPPLGSTRQEALKWNRDQGRRARHQASIWGRGSGLIYREMVRLGRLEALEFFRAERGAANADLENYGWSDLGHQVLDQASWIPGVGKVADGINAALYAVEGDWKSAGLSALGAGKFKKVAGISEGLRHGIVGSGVKVVSERAARRALFRELGVPTSIANNFRRLRAWGSNRHLRGRHGEPWEQIEITTPGGGKIVRGNHKHGHRFEDEGIYEGPHYDGPNGNIYYEP
jgi:RHS repeat-associated protein